MWSSCVAPVVLLGRAVATIRFISTGLFASSRSIYFMFRRFAAAVAFVSSRMSLSHAVKVCRTHLAISSRSCMHVCRYVCAGAGSSTAALSEAARGTFGVTDRALSHLSRMGFTYYHFNNLRFRNSPKLCSFSCVVCISLETCSCSSCCFK